VIRSLQWLRVRFIGLNCCCRNRRILQRQPLMLLTKHFKLFSLGGFGGAQNSQFRPTWRWVSSSIYFCINTLYLCQKCSLQAGKYFGIVVVAVKWNKHIHINIRIHKYKHYMFVINVRASLHESLVCFDYVLFSISPCKTTMLVHCLLVLYNFITCILNVTSVQKYTFSCPDWPKHLLKNKSLTKKPFGFLI
jgi:hypothetical protein